ncbi:unnamed protein product, partial [Linum tenue]
ILVASVGCTIFSAAFCSHQCSLSSLIFSLLISRSTTHMPPSSKSRKRKGRINGNLFGEPMSRPVSSASEDKIPQTESPRLNILTTAARRHHLD